MRRCVSCGVGAGATTAWAGRASRSTRGAFERPRPPSTPVQTIAEMIIEEAAVDAMALRMDVSSGGTGVMTTSAPAPTAALCGSPVSRPPPAVTAPSSDTAPGLASPVPAPVPGQSVATVQTAAPPSEVPVVAGSGSGRREVRKRLFVCGLALDYCVIDTALSAVRSALFDDVIIVYDATRAAHIASVGAFGSGFLTDPASLIADCEAAGVKLAMLSSLA